MPRPLVTILLTLALTLAVQTEAQAQSDLGRLPVKRVVLYKNGVGYFEHSTHVHGTQELNIDFTTAQLNDVLKSLTVVDLGEGRISSVRYNSIAPLSERLKGLRLPFGEDVDRDAFLTALRGARVDVRSGDVRSGNVTATGKLLSVEKVKHQNAKGEDLYETTEFAIVTDSGEMRSFVLSPAVSVHLADRELTGEVGRYLDLVGSSRARDLRRMTITATGDGDRNVFVSYISEVPIWKSTYRIILSEKYPGKPLLQGWAIIDNTIGEDWKNVHLSLVAGAPQSFVQNISQPQYTRRPEIALPQSVMLTPQSHEATLEEDKGEVATEIVNGQVGSGSGGGVGNGSGSYQVAGVIGGIVSSNAAPPPAASPANGRNFSQLQQFAKLQKMPLESRNFSNMAAATADVANQTEGKSLGDFFEYDIKQNITIGKNQSALVPILQAHVEADKVTLWNADSFPLRSLWVKNTSGQILDSGSFNIIEGDTFVGEGLIDTLHPDERRLLSYAGDPAVHVKVEQDNRNNSYSRIVMAKGYMTMTQEQRETKKYSIHNADKTARVVVIEHPARENWKFADTTPKPEETSASFHRFKVNVEPGKTSELTVEEFHPEASVTQISNLDDNTVELLVSQNRMTPAMKQVFDRVLTQKEKVRDFDRQINERNQETNQINTDQARLRENMKALKGSAEEKALLSRYTHQLDSQEDRLAALRKEIAALQAQRNQANAELERMVLDVNVDEKF